MQQVSRCVLIRPGAPARCCHNLPFECVKISMNSVWHSTLWCSCAHAYKVRSNKIKYPNWHNWKFNYYSYLLFTIYEFMLVIKLLAAKAVFTFGFYLFLCPKLHINRICVVLNQSDLRSITGYSNCCAFNCACVEVIFCTCVLHRLSSHSRCSAIKLTYIELIFVTSNLDELSS